MRKTFTYLVLSSLLLSNISIASAKITPQKLATDGRIKVVPYQKDNVVPILATTFVTTQISFSPNEAIEDIEGGDAAGWEVSVNKDLPYMLFLKPTILGSDSNLTVITNKRAYYFHIKSNSQEKVATNTQTYAVRFIYPNEVRAKRNAKLHHKESEKAASLSAPQHPGDYNWHYTYSGSHSILPRHVYDDGTFTYMQLQAHQAIPAVFAVDNNDGSETVVNFRREGQFLIIHRTAPQFTLRDGKGQVASIFNQQAISQLRG